MKLYKITDKNDKTRAGYQNECQWGENVTHRAKGKGKNLCSEDFIHAYTDPLLAVFFNPLGGNYDEKTMLLWEAEGRISAKEVDKVGCRSLTTIKKIQKPEITTEQRVEIAIRLAVKVYKETSFIKWANSWLDTSDRTEAAARAAAGAAAWAAEAAARAAWAAARAAEAAEAAWAAEAAARALSVLDIIMEVKDG